MIDTLIGVWSVPVIAAAAMSGGLFGFAAIGLALRNPLFSSGIASPVQNAVLVTLEAIIGGSFFWTGQVASAYAAGDELWWRVASRFSVWVVFCLAIGVGVFLATRRDRTRRHRAARERVQHEPGGGSR